MFFPPDGFGAVFEELRNVFLQLDQVGGEELGQFAAEVGAGFEFLPDVEAGLETAENTVAWAGVFEFSGEGGLTLGDAGYGLGQAMPEGVGADVDAEIVVQRVAEGAGGDHQHVGDAEWLDVVHVGGGFGVEHDVALLAQIAAQAEQFGGLAGAAETGEQLHGLDVGEIDAVLHHGDRIVFVHMLVDGFVKRVIGFECAIGHAAVDAADELPIRWAECHSPLSLGGHARRCYHGGRLCSITRACPPQTPARSRCCSAMKLPRRLFWRRSERGGCIMRG